MREYNRQKVTTDINSFLTKDIEDYTIKDCEDYLAKYPNDLDADIVRKRLEQLQSPKTSTEVLSSGRVDNMQKDTGSKNNSVIRSNSSTDTHLQSKKIEDYTLEDCKYFLREFPDDPKVPKVKEVLRKHRDKINESSRGKYHEGKGISASSGASERGAYEFPTREAESKDSLDRLYEGSIFGKVICGIGAILWGLFLLWLFSESKIGKIILSIFE